MTTPTGLTHTPANICDQLAVERPTLLLNKQCAVRNIRRMADKAQRSGVRLRPHFKTHQSVAIGEWFRAVGIEGITVSSIDMAQYFANHGWRDITVAFPANVRQMCRINELAATITLGLLVESQETAAALSQALRHDVDVWIKIDVGYGRTGIAWHALDTISSLARMIASEPRLRLQGIVCHAGHSYNAATAADVRAIYQETLTRMHAVRDRLVRDGIGTVAVSIGDTPTCSIMEDVRGVDEIRPGNFVFYDLQQLTIGACREEDIAIALACPVVAKHPERNTLVLYGGAVHLSKDVLVQADGTKCYGRIALGEQHGWGPIVKDVYVAALSQEHGIVAAPPAFIEQARIGDVLLVLPVHACLTADVMKQYTTLDGETISMFVPWQ